MISAKAIRLCWPAFQRIEGIEIFHILEKIPKMVLVQLITDGNFDKDSRLKSNKKPVFLAAQKKGKWIIISKRYWK